MQNSTQRSIIINGREIQYNLRLSRRSRQLRLCVHRGGTLSVVVPHAMNTKLVEMTIQKFIHRKGKWILKNVDRLKKFAPLPAKKTIKERRAEYLQYKEQARTLVARRLEHFNKFYGFTYRNITIRNQTSRWGSCSQNKNLSFNYRIALLPTTLADYIVVHELCHIGQMNHSKKFWDLVKKTIPDAAARRSELRTKHSLL